MTQIGEPFRVPGSSFQVRTGSGPGFLVQSSTFLVPGSRVSVPGSQFHVRGFQVHGSRFEVRTWKPEPRTLNFEPVRTWNVEPGTWNPSLFPLDRRRWLRRDVVDHAIDPAHFVHDP